MHKLMGGALAVLALGGCASVADQPGTVAQQKQQASRVAEDDTPLTGSRLKRKSTDRMLRSVGAQDARDAMDSAPDPIKPQGQ